MSIVMLNPTAGSAKAKDLIPKLATLDGIKLGLLDNSKNNVGALLKLIGDRLREGNGVSDLHFEKKPIYARPATPEQLGRFADCNAVLTAVGD